MGSIWLRELDAWCRADNIPFREYPGWRTRARSSGGFDQVWGIVAHHTGSAPGSSWQNDCAYMWMNATDRPIGNVHLDRNGVITLGAAGATNTNGRGIGPWQTSKGVIPIEPSSMGNRMAFAIEAANNGVGELWPQVQMNMYIRFMAMLCRRCGLDPMRDIDTHRGWAGTRKSDPFGPVDGYPTLGNQTWPTAALRKLVAPVQPPPPPPPPGKVVTVVFLKRRKGTSTAGWEGAASFDNRATFEGCNATQWANLLASGQCFDWSTFRLVDSSDDVTWSAS